LCLFFEENLLIDPFSKGWVCFVALEMDERAARYSLGLKRGYSGGTGFLNDGTQGLYSWHVLAQAGHRTTSLPGVEVFDYVGSFANLSYSSDINQINRYQGSRNNAVMAAVYPGKLASTVLNDVAVELAEFERSLPSGYRLAQFGDAEARAESFGQLFSTSFFFLALIVITLVVILNSFAQAAVILLVGVLCLGLGFLGMFVGFQNFGFIGLVGIVGLAGLAINDSIVVLSHLNEDAGGGQISKHKLVETTIRSTRHILTTSLTTMGGLLPLVFDRFFETLAWAMCFGVMGSALLSLLLIPSMYCFLGKVRS
jgi:multidrug efflux pump subunit AcrB